MCRMLMQIKSKGESTKSDLKQNDAKNGFLNKLTEEATGKQVIALPIEATALGNLKVQMEV